ncbi:MAG: hypothetical protein KGH69_04360 [Candidatus Micrarchaeota archaeon]|nr:hypothetical protein [Candidatus Micrarchaeota archaeon]
MRALVSIAASSLSTSLERLGDRKADEGLHMEARKLYRRALGVETWMYERRGGMRTPRTGEYLLRTERIKDLEYKIGNAKAAARMACSSE